MTNNKLNILLRGLIQENPVLILVLGACPAIATSSSIKSAFFMGLAATAVLICSNIVISALRKLIPTVVRIPCYIVVIAGFVTVVQMLIQAFIPTLYEVLGVYLALITVNCIILGRAEMFASKNTVAASALDGIGMGIGFTIALLAMAVVREILGAGTFAGIELPFFISHKIELFAKAPGGLMVYGILIAVVNKITKGKVIKKKEFSCAGCPSAAACSGECTAKEEK